MAILKGSLGFKGEHGDSAYEIAVKNGYEGTEAEWIEHFGLDLSGYVQTTDVVDNLTSTYTTRPLSAKQGKELDTAKQDTLISGTNIKTINSNSLLGSGNISLPTTSEVGDVANLETTADTVVGAINELVAKEGNLTNLTTTDDSSLVNAINEIHNDLYFKSGDSYVVPGYTPCIGHLTGGLKAIAFVVPVPKSLKNINAIELVNDFVADIRIPSGGYIDLNNMEYTITTNKCSDFLIRVTLSSSTNFYSTNNIPLAIDLHTGATFNLSYVEPES